MFCPSYCLCSGSESGSRNRHSVLCTCFTEAVLSGTGEPGKPDGAREKDLSMFVVPARHELQSHLSLEQASHQSWSHLDARGQAFWITELAVGCPRGGEHNFLGYVITTDQWHFSREEMNCQVLLTTNTRSIWGRGSQPRYEGLGSGASTASTTPAALPDVVMPACSVYQISAGFRPLPFPSRCRPTWWVGGDSPTEGSFFDSEAEGTPSRHPFHVFASPETFPTPLSATYCWDPPLAQSKLKSLGKCSLRVLL